jgi:hypothetical protein
MSKAYKVIEVSEVNVPLIDSERHLVKIIKTGAAV